MTATSEDNGKSRRRLLLSIEDDQDVAGFIRKAFVKDLEVLNAKTLNGASEILAKLTVTHVVGDLNAFESQVDGERFMAYWRRVRPSIERVVLYTGADVDAIEQYPEIDAIVVKTAPLAFLIRALRLKK